MLDVFFNFCYRVGEDASKERPRSLIFISNELRIKPVKARSEANDDFAGKHVIYSFLSSRCIGLVDF